ncbi:alpha/beta-hydrolase [Athelia psychrophila]|uniref:Alpha/beta-hydrolase n=1 Tax=Athelia psychrophila TaxID=1759441 RepID=A0A166CG93_9AGAM|nr:alpha/beta-hydrolase [Fibularhizoctonia sp. CBS 109695]
MASALLTTALLGALSSAVAQTPPSSTPPSSWPQNYTGIPTGGYSTAWQNYFEVTDPLPNVTAPLARSFAGSILTNRPDHRNTSLFFWGFEKANGSLTAVNASDDEPWLIWLNGGPGASSFLGFFLENGPLEIQDDYTIKQNNYSWSKQADTFWVDQPAPDPDPAGTGFSTTDADGYVADQEQVGEDFVGFLANLVAVWTMRGSRTSTGMPRPRWTRGTVTNEDDTYVAVMVGTQVSSLIAGVGASNKFMGGTSTGKAVSVAYGSGSFSGTEYTESVTFAGATVATSSSGFTGVDGIIGFGPVIFWVEHRVLLGCRRLRDHLWHHLLLRDTQDSKHALSEVPDPRAQTAYLVVRLAPAPHVRQLSQRALLVLLMPCMCTHQWPKAPAAETQGCMQDMHMQLMAYVFLPCSTCHSKGQQLAKRSGFWQVLVYQLRTSRTTVIGEAQGPN